MATRKKPARRKPRSRLAKGYATGHVRAFLGGDEIGPDGYPSGSGVVTPDTALTLPHYYACLRVISQTVALLPRGVRERTDRGNRDVRDHMIAWLLNNPHPWMTPFAFWQLLVHWAAGWGLGMARIVWDSRGEPLRMEPMHPSCVRPEIINGALWWEWRRYTPSGWETVYVLDDEVFRIFGMGGDGITGYSMIQYAALAIGQGLDHQSYGSSFFRNGVWGSGIVEYPQALKPEARAALEKSINERFAGPRRSFKPLLFEGGMKWNTLTIPNDEAQLIEFGKFNAYAVCRIIGVQPHKIGLLEGAKYKNIEEENIAWVQDGVQPWTQRIEEEGQRKFFTRPGKLYIHLNLKGLLRADYATRVEAGQKRINSGTMSPNMFLMLEDEELIPGPEGDAFYMQSGTAPLKDIYEGKAPGPVAAANAGKPAGAKPDAPPADDTSDDATTGTDAQSVAAPLDFAALAECHRHAFLAAARHVLRREANALARVRPKYGDGPALRAWAETWQRSERKNTEAAFEAPVRCLEALSVASGMGPLTGSLSAVFDSWQAAAVERASSGVDEAVLGPSMAGEAFAAAMNGATHGQA